jgi:hypothetical protein
LLDPDEHSEHWWDGTRDLSRFAGQRGVLIVENTGGRDSDWIAWSRLRIVPKGDVPADSAAGVRPLPEKMLLADFSEAQISSEVAWSAGDLLNGHAAGLLLQDRGGESREAMLVLPATSVRFPVTIPNNGHLRFALSTGQNRGCGGEPSVAFESGGESATLFHLILDDDLDREVWWHGELDLSRFQGKSGVLLFRNDAPRACEVAAWSDLELTSKDLRFTAGRPLADRGISLLDLLPSMRLDFDRTETYPDYEKFDTPSGKPAFVWRDCPARPARMSLVTVAGARLRYDFPSLPAHSYISFGVAHGTGVGDGVEAHVYWEDVEGREEIYQRLVTPQMRDWEDAIVPLPRRAVAGGTLSIEASSGPKHNSIGDWLAWSRLRIIH